MRVVDGGFNSELLWRLPCTGEWHWHDMTAFSSFGGGSSCEKCRCMQSTATATATAISCWPSSKLLYCRSPHQPKKYSRSVSSSIQVSRRWIKSHHKVLRLVFKFNLLSIPWIHYSTLALIDISQDIWDIFDILIQILTNFDINSQHYIYMIIFRGKLSLYFV